MSVGKPPEQTTLKKPCGPMIYTIQSGATAWEAGVPQCIIGVTLFSVLIVLLMWCTQ